MKTGVPCYGNELNVGLDRTGTGILEDLFSSFAYDTLIGEVGEETQRTASRHTIVLVVTLYNMKITCEYYDKLS
ncbi:MAG TPA: hypothetical protein VHD63_10180 [Ktedonobacteraceae bacterium]|nr:hypothetical protein [Ktedonobacteraceae bacterium]